MSLRDKYLSLVIVAVLFSTNIFSQYDSTKTRQVQSSYGFEWKNAKFGTIIIGLDTPKMAVKDSGAIAYKGGSQWLWTGLRWKPSSMDTAQFATITYVTNYIDSSIKTYNTVNGIDSTTIKLSGSVTITSGFIGQTTAMGYKILGRYYTAPPSAFTLPSSNVSSDKFAIVYGDTLGNIGVLSGVGSNPASIPLDQINPRSQIVLAIYLIKALSITPDGVSNLAVYQENIEWTGVTNVAGGVFNYTTNPRSGSVSTYLPNFTSSQSCYFQDVSFRDFRTNSFVKFWIKLSAPPTGNIFVEFTGTGNVTSNVFLSIRHGYNPNLTAWQFIAIDASEFNLLSPSVLFNKLQFFLTGTGTVQLDDIFLQQGGANVPTNTGVLSFNGKNGHVNYRAADSAKTNADTTLYEFYGNGIKLFTLPTYVQYLSTDTCFTLDTVGRKVNIRFNANCKGSGVGGTTDTTSLSNRINQKLNTIDTAAMVSPYKTSYPRQSISLTTTGSGAATYNNSTGIINVPTPAGGGSGTLTDFTAGTLSPLFTTSVATSTTTPALTFNPSTTAQYTVLGRKAGGAGAYSFLAADSSLIPDLHSQGYYDGRYGALGGSGWKTTGGNVGVNIPDESVYLGTNNNTSLLFKTNNIRRLVIDSMGNVAIGTLPLPAYKLVVDGPMYATGGATGVGYWVADQNAIRGGGVLYIDSDQSLGGTIYVRSASLQVTGGAFVSSLTSATFISADKGTGYRLGTIPLFNVDLTETILRVNDNSTVSKIGYRGSQNKMSDEISSPAVWTYLPSALLELSSTTKGFLPPRMTKAQRDAIGSPAQGLMVFVTDGTGYLSWYSGGWQKVSSIAD